MSYATTFNGGNSMAVDLSNKAAGIRLDTTVSPAEIQAKIKEHYPNLQNQNLINMQTPLSYDTFQNQPQIINSNQAVQYNPYQTPYQAPYQVPYQAPYQNYQMTASYPVYQQPVQNVQTPYYNNMPQPVYQTAQTSYIQPQTVNNTPYVQTAQNTAYIQPNTQASYSVPQPALYDTTSAYQNNTSQNTQPSGQNLDINSNNYLPDTVFETNNPQGLEAYYAEVSNKEGIISKGIDKIKSLFNMKGSSKDAQSAIEQYNGGLISYDEAMNKIKEYENKQSSSTGAVTTALSAIGAYIGSAYTASKGSSSGKAAMIAALIGAGVKMFAGVLDRSTNKTAGDNLSAKELISDVSKGAIAGAITSGASSLSSDKFIVPSGSNGAITGAITGAATGITDYSIDTIKNGSEFSINDMISNSVKYAAGGTAIGALTGKISSKFIKTNPKIINQASASSGNTAGNLRTQTKITSFDDCKSLLQSGNNVSSTERVAAIKEGVKYETDEGVRKLYQQFLDNPNEETLKKFYRAASKKYHPDLAANKSVEAAGEKFVYYGNLQSFAEKNMALFQKAA